MADIGIFFGTDSGTTRLIAKKIARNLKKRLGDDVVAKPLNVNRASASDLTNYSALIIGTPTYADGGLPGKENNTREASWLEFLPELKGVDFSGKRVALYGLGDQEEYPDFFLDGMGILHAFFSAAGATLIGGCSTEGYQFNRSRAVIDGRFVGLALDQHLQHLLTDQRIDTWLDEIQPLLLEGAANH